ncbi:MAG: hypothetical protein Q9216_004100 [Gyalolechia sp. 2 TL-2023]
MSGHSPPTRQWKPIALVPVGLKEAALDSPTFRSGVLHFADQVDLVERWLDSWLKSAMKITQEAGALEGAVNGFMSQMIPSTHFSEAVLDHDYTLLALNSYGEGSRELWASIILGMKKTESNMMEPVRSLIQNDIKAFKETRRLLEQTQRVFDNLHYRCSAHTRTKEPSSLREDAFQLHEARKAYLKASMDFSVAAPQLRTILDRVLVKVFSDQWREMINAKGSLDMMSRNWNNDIERVRSWSQEIETGEVAFRRDLYNARRQIEDSTESRLRPSRDLEDYATPPNSATGTRASTTTTDLQSRVDQASSRAEKQGWLYLRTLSGKPTKTIWTRRWFFVKNGIFGWLVQGSRSGGVEESDRIGVLLCNVRPAQSEERRFAFEVKTKDLSIVLQADSQGELVGWMKAFEIAKQKALEDPASTDSPGLEGPSQDPAFAISSPPAPEFAASAADSSMHQFKEDGFLAGGERGSILLVPGGDSGFGAPSRSSTDASGHRRSAAGDRETESGRDHAARIIQKLDLHKKSTGGPQLTPNSGAPPPSSPALAGGGIASLIAASHSVMPVGPGTLPQPLPTDALALRVAGSGKPFDLPSSSLAPKTLVNAPAPTNLSATAVVVSGERGIGLGRTDVTGGMPSGVMANVWGSSNWGYLNRLERGEVTVPQPIPMATLSSSSIRGSGSPPTQDHRSANRAEGAERTASPRTSSPSHRKTTSLPSGVKDVPSPYLQAVEYPSYYPLQLKTQDAQFRLLFPNVSQAERVVMVFRATWSLNEQQEFPGRVYVTDRYIYFYSHHLGLVLTSGIALISISEVTAAPGRNYDLLFLHLREASDIAPSTRVTVKAFLEPLIILQQRLNFMISSCNSGQPPDVETIIRHLIKLDQNESTNSLGKDDQEDLTGTATSDDGRARTKPLSDYNRDLRATVMFDGKMYGNTYDVTKDTSKIKLPRQPVLYVPSSMGRAVVDMVLDISSKALFHVMFGDKSAVWQLLYHEHHAQGIKQGSWTLSEQRHLRRNFEYQTQYHDIFGRNIKVLDYQMIDVLNDHLCYVVTTRKTPWQLPRSQKFSLLTKIIITHHAKSKCKLAIYNKVDWTQTAGIFQGLITERALKDLEVDAMNLSNLVIDQVKKLGAQSRTKKAILIFGQVGVQTQALEFAGSDSPLATQVRSMKHRTMARLLADLIGSYIQSIVTSIVQLTLTIIRWFWKTVDANMILLAILAVSVLVNVSYSSNGTMQWWSDRQARNYLARLGIGSEHVMGKAIYLRDVNDAWTPQVRTFDEPGSACRNIFSAYLDADTNAPKLSPSASLAEPAHRASLSRLRRSQQRLGSRRHDLVVALRVINSIEQEMVNAEWEGWLYGEVARCKQIEMRLHKDATGSVNGNDRSETGKQQSLGIEHVSWSDVRSWHENYCSSCFMEEESLVEKQARSSG